MQSIRKIRIKFGKLFGTMPKLNAGDRSTGFFTSTKIFTKFLPMQNINDYDLVLIRKTDDIYLVHYMRGNHYYLFGCMYFKKNKPYIFTEVKSTLINTMVFNKTFITETTDGLSYYSIINPKNNYTN